MGKYVDLVDELTLSEKAQLLVGYSTWSTFSIPRLNIPSLIVSDGPTGVRKEKENRNSANGLTQTELATCLPTSATLANSFNEDLLFKVGDAIAKECRFYGVNVLLAPGMNIKRNPLCGRNFEYFSEDPILAGRLASSFVKGVQSNNVGVTLKHFAGNSNEKWRYVSSSNINKRALHEIYLRQFEIAVKEANASGIMTAYNKVNHVFCSDSKYLVNDILRKKWGFNGIVMTDWGGLSNRVNAIKAGTDLEMPGVNIATINDIIRAYKNNELSMEEIDNSVHNILDALDKFHQEKINDKEIFDKNIEVAISSAVESAVLLKNDGILPLSKDKKYLIIGDLFTNMRYQGAGSSQVNSYKIIDNKEAFDKANIDYDFVRGYDQFSLSEDSILLKEAILKAKEYETIIYFGGLTNASESEGFDRETLKLPVNQIALINELSKLNKKIVFVMYGGSPYEIPHLDSFNAMLNMYLPGEGGGEALKRLLFGEVSPSGHLNETWPISYDDVIFNNEYASSGEENYKESIYVGYRYYSSINKSVLFPFGYGLSYSTFEYSDFLVKKDDDHIVVSFKVTNTGDRLAKAVPQIYVSKKESDYFRAKLELKGFTKVELASKESKDVKISIPLSYLEIYSHVIDEFFLEEGEYSFLLGNHVNDILCSENIYLEGRRIDPNYSGNIKKYYFDPIHLDEVNKETFEELYGEKIPEYVVSKKPYNFETPIMEFNSFFGKIVKNSLVKQLSKPFKKDMKSSDLKVRELAYKNYYFMSKMILSNSFRSLSYSSSGLLTKNVAMGLVEISNGRLFKGLHCILKKEKLIKE